MARVAETDSFDIAAALEMNFEQCVEARRQINRALVQFNELAKRIPREEEHVDQREADGDSGTRRSGSEPPSDRPSYGYLRQTVRRVVGSNSSEVPLIERPEKASLYRQQILELLKSCKGNLVRTKQ